MKACLRNHDCRRFELIIQLMKKSILIFILFSTLSAFSQSQKKPNIIILLADDLGWGDVGYHGSDIRTPNIDQLAKEGVILNRFYTASICSPTRAGLLTGRYPDRFGLRETVIPPWSEFGVDTNEVFIPRQKDEKTAINVLRRKLGEPPPGAGPGEGWGSIAAENQSQGMSLKQMAAKGLLTG